MAPIKPRGRHQTCFAGTNHRPDVPSVLATAARSALRAPSIHNTQPWRWRVYSDRLELHAEPQWRLPMADPEGHLLLLSCGAALHHARTAIRAMGFLPAVQRFPDPSRHELLARISVDKPIGLTGQAVDLMRALLIRRTDRGSLSGAPLPTPALTAMRQAAASEGVWLALLNPDQAHKVIATATRADLAELADPRYRAELGAWTGRTDDAGIPREVRSPRGGRYPAADNYLVLYGNGDRDASWLRAGEALSAVWLTATVHALHVQPVSSLIEMSAGRDALHQILSGSGFPYLVLRAGFPATPNGAARGSADPAAEHRRAERNGTDPSAAERNRTTADRGEPADAPHNGTARGGDDPVTTPRRAPRKAIREM